MYSINSNAYIRVSHILPGLAEESWISVSQRRIMQEENSHFMAATFTDTESLQILHVQLLITAQDIQNQKHIPGFVKDAASQ